jgi:VWFA-related protein
MPTRSATQAAAVVLYSFFVLPFSFLALVAAQAPTFRTGTTLIEFTIVALDSEGNPITDLTKDDLVLTDGGRMREIAFFRFDGDAPAVSSAPPPALLAGFVTNRPAAERNVTAIALDLININTMDENEKHNQGTVRNQLLAYLKQLPPNSLVGLFRFSERQPITALQTFTDRVDLVRRQVQDFQMAVRRELEVPTARTSGVGSAADTAAFAAAEARALGHINGQLREMRITKTLASLEALGNHMAGIPGRKTLVWISDGIPIQDPDTKDTFGRGIRDSAQRLANQGISLYPVMAAGLAPDRRPDNSEVATFSVFADVTGGRLVKDNNDLTLGVTLAATDQRATYTIGFYASDEQTDAWQRLKVDVKRRNASIRHRQGYLAVRRSQPQSWAAKNWNEVAYQPLDSTAIRLNARSDREGTEVTISLQVVSDDLYFHEKDGVVLADLEVGLVEKTADGPTNVRARPIEVTLKGATKEGPGALVPMKATWAVNPATTAFRVIVRDRFTGRYGTLDLPESR